MKLVNIYPRAFRVISELFGASGFHPLRLVCLAFAVILFLAPVSFAQQPDGASDKDFYTQVRAFALGGGSANVSNLVLNRDRVQMTFNGTFYFATPLNGRVTGAVFVGSGNFSASVPPGEFEKENVKRLLGADSVESDFSTAVLRFSDDTFEQVSKNMSPAPLDANAQKLANDTEARVLKETGANLSARVAMSILDQEKPGVFYASFDGGRRGRFAFVLDYQTRMPVANFGLNGGEKGLVYRYQSDIYNPEIWLAFYGQDDYQRGVVAYSDLNDQIDITSFNLDLDLRDNKKLVRLLARIQSETGWQPARGFFHYWEVPQRV